MQTLTTRPSALLLAGVLLATAATTSAQVSLTTLGQTITQNFDAPAGVTNTSTTYTWTDNTTLPGWFSQSSVEGVATNGITYQNPGGISATQILYSYNFSTTGGDAGTGRGFGSRTTGTGTFAFAFALTNNTGQTLSGANISFVTSLWRTAANNTSDSLSVGYAFTTGTNWTGLSYTSLSGLSSTTSQGATGGGVNTNPNTSGLFENKSTSLSGLSWATGQTLFLRFADGTGSAAWGVDNFQMTGFTAAIPEPSAFAALAGLAGLGFAATRRRRV